MFRFGSSANGSSKSTTRGGDATPSTPTSPVLTVSIPDVMEEVDSGGVASLPGSSTRNSFALPPPSLWDTTSSTDPEMSTTNGSSYSSSPSSSSPPFDSPKNVQMKSTAAAAVGVQKKQQPNQSPLHQQEPQHRRVQLVEAAPATRGFSRSGKGSKVGGGGDKVATTRSFSTYRRSAASGQLTSVDSASTTSTPTWVRSPSIYATSSPSIPSTPTTPGFISSRTAVPSSKTESQSTMGFTPSIVAPTTTTTASKLAPPDHTTTANPATTATAGTTTFTSPYHPPTPEPRLFADRAMQDQHYLDQDNSIRMATRDKRPSPSRLSSSTGGWFSAFFLETKQRQRSTNEEDGEFLFDSHGDDTLNDLEEDERKYGQAQIFGRLRRRRSSSSDNFGSGRRRGGGGHNSPGWVSRLQKRYFIWKRQRRRLYSLIRLVVLALLSLAVVFTTLELFLGFDIDGDDDPLRRSGPGSSEMARQGTFNGFDYNLRDLGGLRKKLPRKKRPISAFDVEAQNYTRYYWDLPTHDVLGGASTIEINEDYMLSKAFAGAMHPTRVIPFYFRASEQFPKNTVTITTLITPDRFKVFCRLVHQYQGPISVATHIRQDEDPDEQFRILNELWATHPELSRFVDLHVIVDKIDFQLNMWRNIGRLFAKTDYFMMLDVDFHIPSGFKKRLHEDKRIQELLMQGAALVVPAFEYSLESDPKDSFYFPDTKRDLSTLHEKGHIRVFHDFFPPGHNATDYQKWFGLNGVKFQGFHAKNQPPTPPPTGDDGRPLVKIPDDEQEPYKVTTFQPKYEPYIIVKREGTPWCDERFVGYGGNKAACLFEIYVSGIDFWVMPQDFLIHQYHDYRDNNRKNGRILNRQIFVNFQQESCFKYLESMILTGEWYTAKADNLREQCQVFEGFLKTADALASQYEAKHPNSLLRSKVFVPDKSEQQEGEQGDGASGREAGLPPHHPIGNNENSHHGEHNEEGEYDQFNLMLRGAIGMQGKVWGGVTPKSYYIDPEASLPPQPLEDPFSSSSESEKQALAVEDSNAGAQVESAPKDNSHVDSNHLDAYREGRIMPGSAPFSFQRDGEQSSGLDDDDNDDVAAAAAAVDEHVAHRQPQDDQAHHRQSDNNPINREGDKVAQDQQQQHLQEEDEEAGVDQIIYRKWSPPASYIDTSPKRPSSTSEKVDAAAPLPPLGAPKSFEEAAVQMEESVLDMMRPKPDSNRR